MERFRNVTILLLFVFFFLTLSNTAIVEEPMCITMEADAVSVYQGQHNLLCYRYEDVPFKPYVQQLYSPNGINVLRDAPSDHLHHHALMYAVAVWDGRVDKSKIDRVYRRWIDSQ